MLLHGPQLNIYNFARLEKNKLVKIEMIEIQPLKVLQVNNSFKQFKFHKNKVQARVLFG